MLHPRGFSTMRKSSSYFLLFITLILLPLALVSTAAAAGDQAAGRSSFFCQGQAPVNAQDQAAGKQQAIQDFLTQGIIQAVGKFLSPTQMSTQYAQIQKQVFAQPSKYIDSYQVFSENENGGSYQVMGQVTVSMDILKKDLEEAGFSVAAGPAASSPAPISDNAQAQNTTPAQAPPVQHSATRGLSPTKKEILWVVPEKWEQEWVLPTDKKDSRSLFVQSVVRELKDYDYSIQLPQAGSLKMDITGNIPPSQVRAMAEALGIRDAVVGTVNYRQVHNKTVKLEIAFRVLSTGSKASDEVRKEQSMEDFSNQEGAMMLASRIVPELNTLLGGTNPAASAGQESTPAEKAAPWTVTLPTGQYPYWREVENALREQFRNMQMASVELGSQEAVVRLEGVDGSAISRLNGLSMPSGVQVHIEAYSAEARTVKMSFSAKPQATPNQ